MTTATWATPERASRVLRMFVLLLMMLIPLAAIYALAMGGPPPRGDMMFFRRRRAWTSGPMGEEMPPPPRPGFVGREVQETCNTKDGVRTCTRIERDLRPGDRPHAQAPDVAPPAQASLAQRADQRLNFADLA